MPRPRRNGTARAYWREVFSGVTPDESQLAAPRRRLRRKLRRRRDHRPDPGGE